MKKKLINELALETIEMMQKQMNTETTVVFKKRLGIDKADEETFELIRERYEIWAKTWIMPKLEKILNETM